jgi:error-prone DNA polymerase
MEGDELVFLDYLATGISLHGHPVGAIRERLAGYGASSTRMLQQGPDGVPVVFGGLVVVRQHPESAKGTVFLLVEDEWGMANVVVPARLYQQHRDTVRYSPFLLVEGRLERNGPVLNVVGRRFVGLEVGALSHRSHDFR